MTDLYKTNLDLILFVNTKRILKHWSPVLTDSFNHDFTIRLIFS